MKKPKASPDSLLRELQRDLGTFLDTNEIKPEDAYVICRNMFVHLAVSSGMPLNKFIRYCKKAYAVRKGMDIKNDRKN